MMLIAALHPGRALQFAWDALAARRAS